MVRSVALGAIIGGIIAFAWGAISWTVLPWHCKTFKKIRNEEFVGWVVKENARKSGIYIIPGLSCGKDGAAKEKWASAAERGPYIFASVIPKGINPSMGGNLITSAITQIVLAGLVSFLLFHTAGLTYFGKVGLVTITGLFAGILGFIPMWNWFGFPTAFTAINLADSIITWFLAGLGIAAVISSSKKKTKSRR